MPEHGFLVQVRRSASTTAEEEHIADLDDLASRLSQFTPEHLAAGTSIRWRRESQPRVWIDIEPGCRRLVMTWRCEYCNTQIQSHSSNPRFVLDGLDRYAPHDHDGQATTIETAKRLIREAYAAVAEAPGESWARLDDIFEHLGEEYRNNIGGRNNPRRTAEIAILLMGGDDADVALNRVRYSAQPNRCLVAHGGGWADAILIGPVLPKEELSDTEPDR